MNSKTLHILGVVAAVALAIAMALQKVRPQWAAPLGIVVALLTDLKGLITAAMARAVVSLFVVLLLGHALFGCATTGAIVQACKPPLTDETQAITNLFSRPDLNEAEAIAVAEGSTIAWCVITEIARSVVGRASSGELALSLSAAAPSPLLTHSAAWLAKHP